MRIRQVKLLWCWMPDKRFRRVWRTDWAGNQFALMDDKNFENLRVIAKILAFPLVYKDPKTTAWAEAYLNQAF